MKINYPPECEKYIQLQTNGDLSLYEDFPEHKHLMKWLEGKEPRWVLEIGAGLGRASVWLNKKMGCPYEDIEFVFIDGDSGEKQFDEIRKNKGEYYNSHKASHAFCEENGLNYLSILTPEEFFGGFKEAFLTRNRFDLVYSFLCVGYHWPLDFYLDKIYPCLNDKCLLAFGIRGIEKKKWVMKQVKAIDQSKYKILELVLKENRSRESLLVLKRK
jgi:SAM-dependent methyltransferase